MEEDVTLENILSKYDTSTHLFCEYEFSCEFRRFTVKPGEEAPLNLLAEHLAFSFDEPKSINYENDTVWGTYFTPREVIQTKSGELKTFPSLEQVTSQVLEYWEKRAIEAKHPIFKARYAGLVWDFSRKIISKSASINIAKLYVDNLLSIVQNKLGKYEYQVIIKLERALSVSQSLKNADLIKSAIDTILEYDRFISDTKNIKTWTVAFDLLVGKTLISTQLEEQIISRLEEKLDKVYKAENEPNKPWAVEFYAVKLAEYYNKKQRREDIRRVLVKIPEAFKINLETAPAMQACGWLEKMQKVFMQFGLKDEEQKILIKLREIGSKIDSEMKPIPFEFSIPKELIKKLINGYLSGTTDNIFDKLVVGYIPKKQEIEKQLSNSVRNAPTYHHIGRKLMDGNGRTVASIGSIQNDPIGNLIGQYSKDIMVSSVTLQLVFEEGIKREKFNVSDIMNYLSRSPVFVENRLPILKRALDAYFDKDYIVTIHLLIPQIEQALRMILEFRGGSTLKYKDGGFHLRILDDILRDPIIEQVLDYDTVTYFKILLTDSRGWNIRNNVCHGISDSKTFTANAACRLIHVLLCLGVLRRTEKTG